MRVTHNSQYVGFVDNLNDIQTRRNREQIKLQTGKDILNLSDNPEKVVDVKIADKQIDQNEKYIEIIDLTISELYSVDENIIRLGDLVSDIRLKSIDATRQPPPTLAVMGDNFRDLVDDMIQIGNHQFNGRYVFSGTKTTAISINPVNPNNSRVPFELVQDEGSEDNPSGLRVVFHGNNEDRIINKTNNSTEVINQKQADIFGVNNELFNLVIELHNTLSYNKKGDLRGSQDFLERDEIEKIDQLQKQLADQSENLTKIGARNGNIINRSQTLYNQLVDENIRLKDYRSIREDADVAEATLNLQREQFALQYALQVGSRINQTSLFDFLR